LPFIKQKLTVATLSKE